MAEPRRATGGDGDRCSGIGWEICLDLAKAGCRIVAAAQRTDRLKSFYEEINAAFVRSAAVELDVSEDGSGIKESIKKAWDAFGRIDVLVNNARIRGTCT